MPLHPDFSKMRQNMVNQYGKEKGERVFWSYINKRGLDETKPMPSKKKEDLSKKEGSLTPGQELEELAKRLFDIPGNKLEVNKTATRYSIPTKKEEYAAPDRIEPVIKNQLPWEEKNKMSEKKEVKKKDEGNPIGVSTGGNNPFKPWYMNQRPYGPPRSPDQKAAAEAVANKFLAATDEIQALWNEMEKGKRAEAKKASIDSMANLNDFLARKFPAKKK